MLRACRYAIIPFAMEVFIELALLENFCMDYTLLYCAKLVSKNRAGWKRVAVAAVAGACFAVLFPLAGLGGVWAAAVKILSGLAICAVAGKFTSFKGYVKFSALFLAFSAALAGALIGIFSLFGLSYAVGGGYVLASVPIGIPLFGALLLVILARRIKNKFSKGGKTEVECLIYSGRAHVKLTGFFDSGNRVSYKGEPVSVIPETAAQKLVDVQSITSVVKIHTVTGSKKIKVFTADRMEIDFGDKIKTYKGVKIGVGAAHTACAVLHPDIQEE